MDISKKAQELYEKLDRQAKDGGYLLNPEKELTMSLVEGLSVNQGRFGQLTCPCRLAAANPKDDLDIVCPCDYRDDDLAEYGSCFCGLYVSPEVYAKGGPQKQTPERRPAAAERKKAAEASKAQAFAPQTSDLSGANLPYPVWRCKVCGYLCANNNPPRVCPVCKATQERFERFL